MTREQRHVPFRMPDRLFDELAAGGGSGEAVAFLERAERTRRLLLLRTLLDKVGSLPTPLTPPAEAWAALKETSEHVPEAVDRLLLEPSTGAWTAHVLRRLHGAAVGPPLWTETGHICVLAVTAAVHARMDADLLVPLSGGALHLPGLGTVRLSDVSPGPHVGRARVRGGELALSLHTADVSSPQHAGVITCRPEPAIVGDVRTPVGGGAHWTPLRTLTIPGASGPAAIPLDDLDPYRDLDEPVPPDRLDADEAEAWQEMFQAAVGILVREGTGAGGQARPGRLDPRGIRTVVPYGRTALTPPAPPTVGVSASSGDAFGAMVISRPGSALALAETLVHEFQHSKLAALLHLFPLLDDDREERYYAPWRADPRHLSGLLHGAYAFTGVAGFWRDRLAEPEHAEAAAYHFALRRLQSRLVVRTLHTSARLTAPGRRLVAGLARTLDAWLRVPVDPAALARARTAAALHRTQWRLRNLAAPAGPDDGTLRFRPDRGFWPDLRTHVFATRPAAPRTPDEHLAAGDPATALDGYARELARDPAAPHALSGWIVARAALDPGHATRRALARPELLQPQPSG